MSSFVRSIRGIALAVIALGVCAACWRFTAKDRPLLAGKDCLLIVLDSLHAAHLGCYGETKPTSPHIDALAARGVLFKRAWSQTSWTLPSTASLMTGLYQESHGVVTTKYMLGDEFRTMAEAFHDAGYECLAFTQNNFASPVFGFGQGSTPTSIWRRRLTTVATLMGACSKRY